MLHQKLFAHHAPSADEQTEGQRNLSRMPKATLVAPARPGGCQKSPELTTDTAWPLSPPQLMGDDVELRVPPHPPLLWAESLGGEEAERKGLGEASHHQGGSRPESVWLPTETRHEAVSYTHLTLPTSLRV